MHMPMHTFISICIYDSEELKISQVPSVFSEYLAASMCPTSPEIRTFLHPPTHAHTHKVSFCQAFTVHLSGGDIAYSQTYEQLLFKSSLTVS